MSRPQNQLPPQFYYNEGEASHYESNTRIQTIQRTMSERAVELLNLPEGSYILDIGAGSGISGETLSRNGYDWEGIDISRDMLNIGIEKEDRGGLLQLDIGQGWRFRAGVFDGAVSISTIQWLCVASKKQDNPFKRCCRFFQSLYQSLRMGARAVLQFYPDGKHQLEMITTAAMKEGFSGGLIIDYPNSAKAKKYYLVLEAGAKRNLGIVEVTGKQEEELCGEDQVKVHKIKPGRRGKKSKKIAKMRDVVIKMKNRLRRKGVMVKADTKYTGRQRRPRF